MLPGKKYTPDDLLRIVRRRIWILLVPVAVGLAGMAVWARSMPDIYWAGTTILVVPQRISEDLVRSTITSSIEDRISSISQSILSRARLEAMIDEFDLYATERRTKVMEDVVAQMRDEINTNIVRSDAFEVSYTGPDPQKVMRVVDRLGSLFIDQSLSYRHELAEDTDAFLDSQLADKLRQLNENQQRLADYKRAFSGQLPSQVQSNLQQVQTANAQVLAAQEAITRHMDRRSVLEGRIAELEVPGAIVTAAPNGDRPAPIGSTLQQLTAAQQRLASLEARGLKPGHPDLETARRQVRDLERKWADESAVASSGSPAPRGVSAAEAGRMARLTEARNELLENDRQVTKSREDERRARAAADAAQTRLEALPARESEMVGLTRDSEILESSYRDLLAKREESRISTNLERRQVGEQFNVLEPARLPERPVSPNRRRLHLMGLGIGLGLGLAFAGLLEYRDRTFKTDEELSLVLGLPVLAVIPLMQSDQDRRREMWRRLAVGMGCSLIVLACVAVFAFAVVG